jgi:hypothetical protein
MPLTAASARAKDTRASTPTMTHQHFAYIARVIRETPMSGLQREAAIDTWTHALARTNPRFDRARFITACMAGPA